MNLPSRLPHRRSPEPASASERIPAHIRQVALRQAQHDPRSRTDLWAGGVIAAAIFLNPLLSLLNAHGLRMTSTIVIAGQLAVTLAAAALLAIRPPRVANYFFVAGGIVFLTWVMAALYNGNFNIKSLYDALLVPIFILLGTSIRRFPVRLVHYLLGLTFALALVEAFFPDWYIGLFNPLDYYRATREWVAAGGTNMADADLYQGANRAGGSWFSFLSNHRVGSIFLEPISLGYFALVCTLIYSTVYRNNPRNYLIAALLCLFLSLLADSRIPTILIVLFTLLQLGRVQLPPLLAALAMPLVMVSAVVAFLTNSLATILPDGDFRLNLTFEPLSRASLWDILLGGLDASNIGDSGVVYLIASFGLLGSLLVFYLCCGFVGLSRWRFAPHIPLFVAIYTTTALLFGGAFFSIKTAALLGFFLGAAGVGRAFAMPAPRPVMQPAPRRYTRPTRSHVRSPAR